MQKIYKKKCHDTMYYHQIPVFIYKIYYPCFTTEYSTTAAKRINEYYSLYSQKTEYYCRTALYPQAVESARYIPNNQPPFNSYEFESVFQITLNQDCVTSLYMDQYEYLGGAHGSTLRLSDTWDFETCGHLDLKQFFPDDASFPEKLFQEMERQIENRMKDSPSSYFDNYSVLLRKNFHPENFYLNCRGIVIYYQQYDIAPYATGIPTFSIPFQENFPTC